MSESDSKPLVLILCTGNSCRSQMAEVLLRRAAGDVLRVESAGSKPSGYVHPLAIEAVKELGIDLSEGRSKSLDEFLDQDVETVITVCGNADQVANGQIKSRTYESTSNDEALLRSSAHFPPTQPTLPFE